MRIILAFGSLSMSLSVASFVQNIKHANISLHVGILIAMGLLLFEFGNIIKK